MAPATPRRVIGGRMDESTGTPIYIITLDGPQEVETTNYDLAAAASQSKRDGRAISIELDSSPAGGRPVLRELQVLAADAAPPVETRAVATRTAQPQALATRPPLPSHLIVNPEELAEQMRAMREHYNVLSPAIAISQMAPGFGANLAIVQIDSTVVFDDKGNGAGPDCYFSAAIHKDKAKRSLNKNGLQKIAAALGIQWDHVACRRLDDGKERNYWLWKYVGYVRTHDGQLQTVEGTRELDLRDGSAEAADMKTQPQLMKQRAMGNQMCETKAMQRAIRTFVQHSYTVDDLKKPFLIVRFSFTPDMNDPEIKKLVTERAMGGIGALYAPPAGQVLPALPAADDGGEAPTPSSTNAGGLATVATKTADPFADTPAATDAITIVKVEKPTGKNPKNGRTWTRYDITFSNGEAVSTFSETLQQLVDEAVTQKAAVKYSSVENEGYNNKLETLTIVDKRQGNLLDGEGKY